MIRVYIPKIFSAIAKQDSDTNLKNDRYRCRLGFVPQPNALKPCRCWVSLRTLREASYYPTYASVAFFF
ncbi:hypothetical protein [Fortiea sp. LEGE XX443]|uniref:hypothetical protein n=1 Tax=Fortiea sp. LEGE XX443 TaxID=1828611 RepID=UPI00187EFF69|nr:hypothetical protein [Fortiea sp. LEGE XX443]